MNELLDKLSKALTNWDTIISKQIEIKGIYLFGSSIYRDGVQFKPEKSDLDLVLVMPDNLTSPIQRLNWLSTVLSHKSELEKEISPLFLKEKEDEEIISVVPVSQMELNYDIHKSSARNFFRTNDFYDIRKAEIINWDEIISYTELKSESGIQVLEAIQKKRNIFFKMSSSAEENELKWSGEDVIPKELARESAKVNAMKNGISKNGDQFNISFGTDFIKSYIQTLIDKDTHYSELYNWIDARSGGRSNSPNKDLLTPKNHTLFYEILYDLVSVEIDTFQLKNNELNNSFLDAIHLTDEFSVFLENIDMLSGAHPTKQKITLSDVFIYPELAKFDSLRSYEKTISSETVINEFLAHPKILIAGESQSGKTTICKKFFSHLIGQRLVPIFITDKENNFLGKIENKIEAAFETQYKTDIKFHDIKKEHIVLIIDNFHFAKHKERLIYDLSEYKMQIIVVDDIYGLNLKDDNLMINYTHYKIEELVPSLRNNLIKNWMSIDDKSTGLKPDENGFYQEMDKSTEFIDGALGKLIGGGIMPAYPFFITSVISAYKSSGKPLDREITSQGHCYQALIYLYLRKEGVKSDEFDTYINFLTEISYFFYKEAAHEISYSKFEEFLKEYLSNYNLPVNREVLLANLARTNIFTKTSLNNYHFCYSYLYYFFVGKYFAENIDKTKGKISSIINNLHKTENAYIAVFISHHSKNSDILDELISTAGSLFKDYAAATLSIEELSFFDEKIELLIQTVLPKSNSNPEKERSKKLKQLDRVERKQKNYHMSPQPVNDEKEDEFSKEMRRGIKTVEVMGTIIKNRAGSLLKPKLENVFDEGMKVQLRVIKSFIELIKDEKNQKMIEDLIVGKLNEAINERGDELSNDQLTSLTKRIFWNTNFSIIDLIINRIIHSLGSDKLVSISDAVCDKVNSPASFIIKHGILMWYGKNLQVDNIADRMDEDGFSKTAKELMYHKIVSHCRMHFVDYKEKQRVENRFGIKQNMLQLKISTKDKNKA